MAVAARELVPSRLPARAPRPALRVVPPPGQPRQRSAAVYRRRRLALLAVVGLLSPALWAATDLAGATPGYLDAPAVQTVLVGEHDTVWGIAAAHRPAGTDLRVYVWEVLAVNGVDASALQPGTVLRLP